MKYLSILFLMCVQLTGVIAGERDYTIVVSSATLADADWQAVVEALEAKYPGAQRLVYKGDVSSAQEKLASIHPRYTCFVATPAEAGRQFVADVHVMTRKLDDDPYTDTRWGILTGADAANAMTIASRKEPLVIAKAAAGTDFELAMVKEGKWYCELNQGKMVQKRNGEITQEPVAPDTTAALVETLNEYQPELFITSGHATQRDWQIGFSYRNGQFRSRGGKMYGYDLKKKRWPVTSDNPKAYMAIGNCLMGHIDGPDAMALAWMNSAGVHQMIGYTVNTWYGYAGWGCIDYFVEQPGRYTFAEAFLANHHALIHRLSSAFDNGAAAVAEPVVGNSPRFRFRPVPNKRAEELKLSARDGYGLRYDRDVVAFYGDPAWNVRMAEQPTRWKQSLSREGDHYVFEVLPLVGDVSFDPVNVNGSQRGYRPFVHLMEKRLRNISVLKGSELKPVITDDMILIPHPGKCDPEKKYRVEFTADPAA